jgi:hypothetical protein
MSNVCEDIYEEDFDSDGGHDLEGNEGTEGGERVECSENRNQDGPTKLASNLDAVVLNREKEEKPSFEDEQGFKSTQVVSSGGSDSK